MDLLTELCIGIGNIKDEPTNDVILFGELFGPGVQDLDYGIPAGEIGWRVYDCSINGSYVNWDVLAPVCLWFGIPLVPVLYTGPYYEGLVDELTNGLTTMVSGPSWIKSPFKGREGIVITPLVETFSNVVGRRLILKSVSADYRDGKGLKMKANCKRWLQCIVVIVIGIVLGVEGPSYIGGIYYSMCGEHPEEQAYLDKCIAHLRAMRLICDDPDLQGILDYTIRRYNKIGPWDVMIFPLTVIPRAGGKVIGCNDPLCPGITLDTLVLLEPPEYGVLHGPSRGDARLLAVLGPRPRYAPGDQVLGDIRPGPHASLPGDPMISDAYVEVTCDGCHDIEIVQLTATACRGWDERNVPDRLKSIGWSIDGDETYCEECTKARSHPTKRRSRHGTR